MDGRDWKPRRRRNHDEATPASVRSSIVSDLLFTLLLPILSLFAWFLPQRCWSPVAHGLGGFIARIYRATTAMLVQRIGHALREGNGPSPEAAAIALRAGKYQQHLQILRDYRPGGWRPATRLSGTEHIDQALARSHGAILWFGDFITDRLAARIALSQAGYRTAHLADPRHGPWNTAFGVRYLNPVFTRIEDRYIRQRILHPPGDELRAIWTLHQELKSNHLLSLNALGGTGQTVRTPFLDGYLPLPVGPIHLAARSKAPILPVFSVRTSSGVIDVNVGAPLAIDRNGDRHQTATLAVRAFADRLSPFVLAYPGQWYGWFSYEPAG